MYQLIIFDWDGTLMDSAQKISNCVRAAARDVFIAEPSDEDAKNIIGLGLRDAMQTLFPAQNDAIIDQVIERYTYHFVTGDDTEQKIFAGVEKGLTALTEQGALLAVATGKSRRGLDRVLVASNLGHHFTVTRCADETRGKPNPQMLQEILDYTAIEPHNSIMIGDTTYDMHMAANAKMHGLGVSYGVHQEDALRKAAAIDVLPSFSHTLQWLLDGRVSRAYD